MQIGEAAALDEVERVGEHGLGLGREAGDEIGAEDRHPGRRRRTSSQKRMASSRTMAALHALQDQIVAGLHREVKMRHQTRFGGDGFEQVIDRLRLDRRTRGASGGSSGTPLSTCLTRRPSDIGARKVGAVGCDVDAGEDDFGGASCDERCGPVRRPRRLATERDGPRPIGMMQKVQR